MSTTNNKDLRDFDFLSDITVSEKTVSHITYIPEKCIICGKKLERAEIVDKKYDECTSEQEMIVTVQRATSEAMMNPRVKRINIDIVSDSIVRVEVFLSPSENDYCNKFWICSNCFTNMWEKIKEDIKNRIPKLRYDSKEELIEMLKNIKDIIAEIAIEVEQKILDGAYTKGWKVKNVLDIVWAEHTYEIFEWKERIEGAILALFKMVLGAIVMRESEKGTNITFEEVWKALCE